MALNALCTKPIDMSYLTPTSHTHKCTEYYFKYCLIELFNYLNCGEIQRLELIVY